MSEAIAVFVGVVFASPRRSCSWWWSGSQDGWAREIERLLLRWQQRDEVRRSQLGDIARISFNPQTKI